jgi:hypothetical protein
VNIATNEQKIIFFTTSAVYIRRQANVKNKKHKNNVFLCFLFLQQIFTTSQVPFFFTTLPPMFGTRM